MNGTLLPGMAGAVLLFIVTALFSGCGGKGAVEAGRLESADGSFTLYTYDDVTDRGNSSIALYRESIMDETGGEDAAWTLRGRVTTKYKYGYAGVVLVPDEKTFEGAFGRGATGVMAPGGREVGHCPAGSLFRLLVFLN
jgi:hypothetical protein